MDEIEIDFLFYKNILIKNLLLDMKWKVFNTFKHENGHLLVYKLKC